MANTFSQFVTFIYVSDLKASAAFYGGQLGLELVLDQGSCYIFRVAGDAFLGVCETKNAFTNREGIIITLVSEAVADWALQLQKQGVVIEKGPLLNAQYNIYHCFLRDPDGYLIEIQQFLDPAWPAPLT